jgi:LacI family transcriptional regulator
MRQDDVPGLRPIVGFDDISWASIVSPALTTVRQPYEILGSRAVELLCKRIESRERRTARLHLPVCLVERESVATLHGND